MRTLKSNLAFLFVCISCYCSVVECSPSQGDEHSPPAKDFGQIRIDLQEEIKTYPFEEILFSFKSLRRYLKNTRKEYLPEKSSDKGYSQVVEDERLSFAAERDVHSSPFVLDYSAGLVTGGQFLIGEKKGMQTLTVDNMPLQAATEKISLPSPHVVNEKSTQERPADGVCQSMVMENEISAENQKTDVHSTPALPNPEAASVAERQSHAGEGDVTHAYVEDNKLLLRVNGKNIPIPEGEEEKDSQEKIVTNDSHQPMVSFSRNVPEIKEESTPRTTATPEYYRHHIADGEPLPAEAKGTQTHASGNQSDTTREENRASFSFPEVLSAGETGGVSGVLDQDVQELEKGISVPQPPREIAKEAEDSKSTWDIWHTSPTLSIIFAVVITLIAAKTGGWLASLVALPEVVGNLIVGIILGNIFFITGSEFFNFLRTMPFLKMIAYFGTLLLLLTAGLHTDLRALLRVGASSFLVSLGGIIAPAGFGLIVGYFLLPDAASSSKLLLAIIVCNTSTGLLFAILSELKAMNTLEGRIITGATILTEIIVILTFGIASGIATKGEVSVINVLVTAGIAFSFLAVVLIIVLKYGEKFGNFLTNRMAEGLKISIVIILSLLFAFISGSIGLHGVIGAFAAGLLLRNVKFKDSDDKEYSNVERVIRPYYMILVPILFVRVGAQVDFESILNMEAVLLGLAITGAAVVGKLFCSVCAIEKGINRMVIGIGMAMKLEGTLILSGIGRDMGILNDVVFSSIIMVIVFTSITCPSLLKTSLVRHKRRLSKNFNVTVDEKTKEIFLRFKSEARG